MSAQATLCDELGRRHYPISEPRWCSDERTSLQVSDLAGITRDAIDGSERSLWRYRAAFPIDLQRPVSLGEGCTPLIRRAFRGHDALFKLEWFAPTGSFKDRGATVMLSLLRQQGVAEVVEGQLRQWRRGGGCLWRGGGHEGSHSGAGQHLRRRRSPRLVPMAPRFT